MQKVKTTHISATEWRWVIIIAGLLATLTVLPYVVALLASAASDEWQFMGILANPLDGAAYLTKIGQGADGHWLVYFAHTPEPPQGAAIHVFYILLGHVANFIRVPEIVIFHLARVATTLFMYSALYVFGATVWARLRPRRIFFTLVSVGSGLAWLLSVLRLPTDNIPDYTVASAYPFYSAYANPHFPLAIGCLALIAASYISVFRISFKEPPTSGNGGLSIVITTLTLALVLPQALVPIGGALTVYLVIHGIRKQQIPIRELRWVMVLVLSAIPLGAYYLVILQNNEQVQAVWNAQSFLDPIPPQLIVAGYGLLLLTAIPGLIRAVRRFEEDADQLMLIWFAVNFLLILWPPFQQRRFIIGLIIPIVFFAVRAIEDYWFRVIAEKWRYPALITLIVFSMPSNVLVLGLPLYGVANPQSGLDDRLLVEIGYWRTMEWLDDHNTGEFGSVVLSSPNISLWIPAWSGHQVVYGHYIETLEGETKLVEVQQWYQGQGCTDLLERYRVRYVVVGPQERAIGDGLANGDACYASLNNVVFEYADVTLYRVDE